MSSLVYAGHGAGGGSTSTNLASGYNYLCMHGSPQYEASSFNTVANSVGARVFRLQYETNNKGLWKLWKVHNEDVPCAVCQSTGALAVLMQPGNSVCPTGWSSEYTGYMMSAPHNTYVGEFVCVDRDAEALTLCTGTASDGQMANDGTTNCAENFAAAGGETSAHCTDGNGAGCQFIESDSSDNAQASLLAPVEMRQENADNALDGYTQYAEVACAVCAQPRADITCPEMSSIADGSVSCTNGVAYGSTCTLTCSLGYKLSNSPPSTVCLDTGEWSEDVSSASCAAAKLAFCGGVCGTGGEGLHGYTGTWVHGYTGTRVRGYREGSSTLHWWGVNNPHPHLRLLHDAAEHW